MKEYPDFEMRSKLFKNSETRLDVYEAVRHQIYYTEAITRVLNYLTEREKEPLCFKADFDYDELAEKFIENHVTNISDDEQWEKLLDEYTAEHNIFLSEDVQGIKRPAKQKEK